MASHSISNVVAAVRARPTGTAPSRVDKRGHREQCLPRHRPPRNGTRTSRKDARRLVPSSAARRGGGTAADKLSTNRAARQRSWYTLPQALVSRRPMRAPADAGSAPRTRTPTHGSCAHAKLGAPPPQRRRRFARRTTTLVPSANEAAARAMPRRPPARSQLGAKRTNANR